jgi:hypothetical protein
MKKTTKLLALSLVMFAFTAATYGQATATVTATIVTPIAIANAGDMNFGNIMASAGGGTVVLSTAGVRTPAGVTLPAITGTVSAAHFNVTGTANLTYTIAITGTPVTVTSGGNNMTVNAFVSNPAAGVGTGLLSAAGAQTIDVGATLTVGASQPAGTYVSGTPFTVTVNYN